MKAFLGRLPLILGVALVCMAAGAGWAGLGTPSYRSLAVVTSSDVDVEALAGSPEVTTEFLDRVRSKFGANTANTTVGFATGSPARVEISTESEVAGKTQDFTAMYLDAMVAVAPNIQVEGVSALGAYSRSLRSLAAQHSRVTHPLRPRSQPNLKPLRPKPLSSKPRRPNTRSSKPRSSKPIRPRCLVKPNRNQQSGRRDFDAALSRNSSRSKLHRCSWSKRRRLLDLARSRPRDRGPTRRQRCAPRQRQPPIARRTTCLRPRRSRSSNLPQQRQPWLCQPQPL